MGRFRLLFLVHPYLFQFGRLVLPTYGFLVAAGTILSLLVWVRNARLLSLDADKVWSVALLVIVTFLVASKILLILLHWGQYGPRALGLSLNGTRDFGVRLAASLLAVAAGVAYCLRRKLPLLRTADAAAPSLALGSSFVSIACLEAGCDYGTPTDLPWAIVFRRPGIVPGAPLGIPLHPTQVYAGLAAFLIFAALSALLHFAHREGEVLGAWLFLAGLANAALLPLRGDSGPLLDGVLPVAQLICAAMVLAGGLLWMRRSRAERVTSLG